MYAYTENSRLELCEDLQDFQEALFYITLKWEI